MAVLYGWSPTAGDIAVVWSHCVPCFTVWKMEMEVRFTFGDFRGQRDHFCDWRHAQYDLHLDIWRHRLGLWGYGRSKAYLHWLGSHGKNQWNLLSALKPPKGRFEQIHEAVDMAWCKCKDSSGNWMVSRNNAPICVLDLYRVGYVSARICKRLYV